MTDLKNIRECIVCGGLLKEDIKQDFCNCHTEQSPERVSVDAVVSALEAIKEDYVIEESNALQLCNHTKARKYGYLEECYRNVISDLKEAH